MSTTQESGRAVAIRASAALLLPTAALGVTFGVLASSAVGALPAIVMSAVIWSGTAQFGALSVLGAGGGVPLAMGTGLLANVRFVPMGFAVAPSLSGGVLRRALTGMLVVDASFALAHRGEGRFDPQTVIWAAPLQYAGWVGGTAAGVFGASVLSDPGQFGLDVLFPVFYLGLLVPELRGSARGYVVAAMSAGVTLALIPVAPVGVPVLAAAATALVGLRKPA
jgi:predicted branched-subunit amino acid permease